MTDAQREALLEACDIMASLTDLDVSCSVHSFAGARSIQLHVHPETTGKSDDFVLGWFAGQGIHVSESVLNTSISTELHHPDIPVKITLYLNQALQSLLTIDDGRYKDGGE